MKRLLRQSSQAAFTSASEALLAANRSARGAGKYLTEQLQEKAKAAIAQQQLNEAQAKFDRAIGEPKPVEVTGIVLKISCRVRGGAA
ncbi:MAG TPA: hypothetical protein VGQ41_09865 [Pyrinomonadaceae bacterium]|jgi:multidrug efflux pump subunit AcrA (membrane-fusion protein)|nr:hypothetical protein [Pyrinomonadaceae bacterium]